MQKMKSPVILTITGLFCGGVGRNRAVARLTASQTRSRSIRCAPPHVSTFASGTTINKVNLRLNIHGRNNYLKLSQEFKEIVC